MNKKDIPNIISTLRIALVLPIAYFLWHENYLIALILFFIGGLSDGLDGFLARRYRWETKLGVILDPMGDKFMMLTAYLLLGWHNLLPWWLASLVILRDMLIVFGTLMYRNYIAKVEFKPSFVSKLNTVFQILLVLLIMVSQVIDINKFIIETLLWIVVVSTLVSGYAYVNLWGRRGWNILKGKEVS